MKLALLLIALASCVGADTPPVPDLMTGDACDADSRCEGGTCLDYLGNQRIVFEGGHCTSECYDGACGDGEECLTYHSTQERYCFLKCESHDECRDEYFCTQVSESGTHACLPGFYQ